MDPLRNPYQPGAGVRPPELAGRDDDLSIVDVTLQRTELGYAERGVVWHGLRGVGKTVLLNEVASRARDRRWLVSKAEAVGDRSTLLPGLTRSLYQGLRAAMGTHDVGRLRRLLGVFKSFSVTVDPTGTYTFGVEVDATRGHADSGDAATDLTDLLRELGSTARELGVGALLVVDELQDAPARELAAINRAIHDSGQGDNPLPTLLMGAGLPSLPGILAEATSYAERLYNYRAVGPLDDQAAEQALNRPAESLGVTWSAEALDITRAATSGYPYFLQTAGRSIWNLAKGSPIDAEDAAAGLVAAREEIDVGLYLSRWSRATAAQRRMMRAMAGHGDGVQIAIAELAREMGMRRSTDLSVSRDQLIKKGLVYAPDRGLLAFTVPGIANYIQRQPDD
ncbi:MAG TPA: ATP-binding protein [Mycobacteriales bacterium]|nr:ATP-binding protein [Mycobacteriales bacterium]